jgi:alpha-glucuronidase
MKRRFTVVIIMCLSGILYQLNADDGYRLWLKYDKIYDKVYLADCHRTFRNIMITGESPVLSSSMEEFLTGLGGMTGVSNIGTERNRTGHLFGQANWDAFGRLAWNSDLSSADIASEWISMTITHDQAIAEGISNMMLSSRETAVNYMTPMGLHHIMARGHHWGPGPWVDTGRSDWTSVYYHRADDMGIGFDRTAAGSDAVSQYFPPLNEIFNNPATCPENLLLFFHHLPWNYRMSSDGTLWDEMCFRYYDGARTVEDYGKFRDTLKGKIDAEQYEHVRQLLNIQAREARWWRDACLLYSRRSQNGNYRKDLKSLTKNLSTIRDLDSITSPAYN